VSRLDLLESLVVDEARRVFWDIQLTFLEMFAELPAMDDMSSFVTCAFKRTQSFRDCEKT
jgi:hypothetical protein